MKGVLASFEDAKIRETIWIEQSNKFLGNVQLLLVCILNIFEGESNQEEDEVLITFSLDVFLNDLSLSGFYPLCDVNFMYLFEYLLN